MPDYRKVYLDRVKQGHARPPAGTSKGDNNSITFDSPNVVDETQAPKVPPKPSPQLPIDDAFKKYRTEKA
jgi:hypothetical protein